MLEVIETFRANKTEENAIKLIERVNVKPNVIMTLEFGEYQLYKEAKEILNA